MEEQSYSSNENFSIPQKEETEPNQLIIFMWRYGIHKMTGDGLMAMLKLPFISTIEIRGLQTSMWESSGWYICQPVLTDPVKTSAIYDVSHAWC